MQSLCSSVQEHACATINTMVHNNLECQELVAAHGGIERIMCAMMRHSGHAGVQKQVGHIRTLPFSKWIKDVAQSILCAVTRRGKGLKILEDEAEEGELFHGGADGEPLSRDKLLTHSGKQGCAALFNLAYGNICNQQRIAGVHLKLKGGASKHEHTFRVHMDPNFTQ